MTAPHELSAIQVGNDRSDVEEDIYFGDGDFMEGEEEDINIISNGEDLDEETNKFDRIVGALTCILMDSDFEALREDFCRTNCTHFANSDENKLIYTDIFRQYTELVETGIETRLQSAVAGFDMSLFLGMLDTRKDELMSDVFDLLLSLGDFEAFRDIMLEYKREFSQDPSSSAGLALSCHALKVHLEDQEEGEERPDLDFTLTITSPVGPAPPRIVQ
eukprot:CAMPEP_0119113306 /NCGR_PEP_ID=MMETSP1180-20130426/43483_1 /TAXON_ID=3052 ORGANISM="Chlamydomonas cf sp, Strain CCMP681" /NCGR_SAMPLE_ID=MMETSP1180 /ASSEMBLY_ACC=CAM_ASM_000741 /LENGTH=217 /DNA_ID=CAMNT_0007101287 /DNA_START=129 /DNA_END=782 /DNA_ORIENTATION=+